MISDRERKLTDIAWQMVLAATNDPVFCAKPASEKAKWFAETLRDCGFPNRPLGSLYHYLTDKPGNEYTGDQ